MKQTWIVVTWINEEYKEYTFIKANTLMQLDENTVVADGVEITFESNILSARSKEDHNKLGEF